ncbi:MAG: hypothetical protein HY237_00735 [Acidobacteria bacterium]|nr:hypothetical protein [Acidobacteriota bacterium]
MIFPGSPAIRWVLGCCTLVLLALAIFSFLGPGAPAWVGGFFVALVVLVFLGWPRTIPLDSEGISQRSYFGGWKRIPWRNVTSIVNRRQDSATFVHGSDGTRILFSPYQVDQDRFHAEVLRRSGRPHLD